MPVNGSNAGNTAAASIKTAYFPGLIFGFRSPSVIASLKCGATLNAATLEAVILYLDEALPGAGASPAVISGTEPANIAGAFAKTVLYAMREFYRAANLPLFEPGSLMGGDLANGHAMVMVPTSTRVLPLTTNALEWLLKVINAVQGGQKPQAFLEGLHELVTKLAAVGPDGSNVPRFLRAAHEMGIPYTELPGAVYQFGHGARARWMDGSFTNETRQIAARLARNKVLSAAMLRRAGIPVPEHALVTSLEEALTTATALGYPVVVKPADRDGGVGVAAGLLTPDEVRDSFAAAQVYSKRILVEKYIEGKDYRVTVFQDEVIWAIERVPGGVTGDGSSNVRQLVEQLNADPLRGTGKHAPLQQLTLDSEAEALLLRNGMDGNSVPPTGTFVRLRRAANIASGGTPVAVFDKVHPDNRLLAVRAAAALQLDLAGVDLLIPDIGRSWKESGAAVCEVNAQPNLGQRTAAHLYTQILRKLVSGNGRIPIAVVLGSADTSTLIADVAAALQEKGFGTGWIDETGVTVRGKQVLDGRVEALAGSEMLMMDRGIDAAVVGITEPGMLRTGLAFDRFDVLVIAGPHITRQAPMDHRAPTQAMYELLGALLPSCTGRVISTAGTGLNLSSFAPLSTARWDEPPVEADSLVDTIVTAIVAAERQHSALPGHL